VGSVKISAALSNESCCVDANGIRADKPAPNADQRTDGATDTSHSAATARRDNPPAIAGMIWCRRSLESSAVILACLFTQQRG